MLYNIGIKSKKEEDKSIFTDNGSGLQEIYCSQQYILPDSSKIIKFNLPEIDESLKNILVVISLQILRKGKIHKNLVTIGSIVRLTNLNGQNIYKLSEVKQKYYHKGGSEFEINEVYKVDGLEMNESEDSSNLASKNK